MGILWIVWYTGCQLHDFICFMVLNPVLYYLYVFIHSYFRKLKITQVSRTFEKLLRNRGEPENCSTRYTQPDGSSWVSQIQYSRYPRTSGCLMFAGHERSLDHYLKERNSKCTEGRWLCRHYIGWSTEESSTMRVIGLETLSTESILPSHRTFHNEVECAYEFRSFKINVRTVYLNFSSTISSNFSVSFPGNVCGSVASEDEWYRSNTHVGIGSSGATSPHTAVRPAPSQRVQQMLCREHQWRLGEAPGGKPEAWVVTCLYWRQAQLASWIWLR